MQNFLLFSALLNGVVSIAAAIAVYYKNKKADINNTFAVFCLFLAFWAFGSFFMMLNPEQALNTLPSQLLRVGALFLAVANFHFIVTILEIAKEKKWFLGIGYAVNSVFFFLIPVHYFIQHYFEGGKVLNQISFWNNEGAMYYFWLAIWVGYVVDAIWLLVKHYLKRQGVKKFQIKYILAGEIITFGALITNFYIHSDIRLISFYNILIPLQIVGFAYNIIRYRFLDVQLSLLNILKRIIAFVFAVVAAFGVSYYLFFRGEEPSILVLFPIVSVFLYFGISSFLNSRYFYRILRLSHIEDFKHAVDLLYQEKLFYKNRSELEKTIQELFIKQLRISSAEIVLLDSKNKSFYESLAKYFRDNKSDCLELKELYLDYKDSDKFKGLGELCFPLWGPNGLIGFFILGSKPHKILYTKQELKVLKSAVFHISVSLRILNFHEDLRKEVERKTKKLSIQAKQLQKAIKELKRFDAQKDSFFAVTAHDLRTPMTVIKGYTDFLLSGEFGKLKPKQKDFIARILSGSNEMLELINNILDINKLNTGRMDFRFANVNVKSFLEEVVKDFQLACGEKNLHLTFENPENLDINIEADPAKLKRVLTNLVGNAIKFTNKDGNITIKLKHADEANMLRFEVKDDGVGIPQASQAKIFETFGQAENFLQKDYNGSGLGLSIVKRIVEKMKGKVWVESEENKGANFIFLLPQTQK